MSITSDEVNYLVYRYLLESGFQHSTFAFQQESNIHTRDYHHQYNYSLGGHLQGIPHQQRPDEIRASRVPPGALIHYLQKGLQYVEVEAHSLEASNLLDWTADGSQKKCGAPFSLVLPHECEPLTEDGLMTEKGGGSGSMTMKSTNNTTNNTAAGAKRDRREGRKGQNSEREKRARKESVVFETPLVTNLNGTEKDANTNGRSVEVEASTSGVKPILSSEITFLVGHKAEVFACAWNPKFMLIATGAGDGTARIWKVPVDPCEPITDAIILDHNIEGEMKDVTTVDWNPGGLSLATGAYDGHARIWSKAGELKHHMTQHLKPVLALKWNRKGDLLVTTDVEGTAIIWDASNGECRQTFSFHKTAIYDIDWKDDITFASCSNDIYVCQLGLLEPVRAYFGHQGDITKVRWDPSGTYLASCSDDNTAKVWTSESDSALWDFTGHTKEIVSIRWSNSTSGPVTTPGSSSEKNRKLLATGSFDSTVRLWDVMNGQCVFLLNNHTSCVFDVAFSPDGQFIASGADDNTLNIWRVADGQLLRNFVGTSKITEVGWGAKGDKISASCYDGTFLL